MDVEGIYTLQKRYTDTLYFQVRKAQGIDQTYIDDTFEVPEIHDPHHIYRAGLGVRIVDAPAEQIITSNPQVFFHPKSAKPTKAQIESALKLSFFINEVWLPILQKQNPNIFKEFIKAQLGRGEAFFKVVHKESWVTGKKEGLPVHFIVLDPMVIYASPEENEEGIPEKVIVLYENQYEDLIVKYPKLTKPTDKEKKTMTWLEYYDNSQRYIEVDKQEITKGGIQPNLYGFTPFVRKYSGFGRRSPDGELSNLIVSDIRRSRDLIREECVVRSNIASIEFLFAHKEKTLLTSGQVNIDEIHDLQKGEYVWNVLSNLPPDSKIITDDTAPDAEMFKHHADIISELNQRHPFIMAGFPWGTSGRQQDMTLTSAMARYNSTVENTQYAFATALKMALKICSKIPSLRPEGISPKDLETEFTIEVKLKAEDPIMEDRRITLGDRLWAGGKGSISLHRFHTEYQGMTEDQSKREIASMLVDQLTIYNPDVAAVMGMVAAEESGMVSWLEKAKERRLLMEQSGQEQGGLREPLPATSQQRIKGEVQSLEGNEEATMRGARQSPEGYNRGG